jgi:hypothetical protein
MSLLCVIAAIVLAFSGVNGWWAFLIIALLVD